MSKLVFIKVRVNEEEKSTWQAQANAEGMTLANLIRTKLGGVDIVNRDPKRVRASRREDPELIRSLSRIGTNLNQIAKWANTYKTQAEAILVISALIALDAKFSLPEKKKYKEKEAKNVL